MKNANRCRDILRGICYKEYSVGLGKRRTKMINFEKELKNFEPSLEVYLFWKTHRIIVSVSWKSMKKGIAHGAQSRFAGHACIFLIRLIRLIPASPGTDASMAFLPLCTLYP